MNSIVDTLLLSEEPSIRYKTRIGVLGEVPQSRAIRNLRAEIKNSLRIKALLQNRDGQGRINPVKNPYRKWTGAHWIIATLADIGYPPEDRTLLPIRDQILDYWLRPEAIREHECADERSARRFRGVPIIQGRARRCASQQGNALFAAVALGLVDERCDQLARLLIRWQWPDGGWNCDRRVEAVHSSFWETLLPLRGLSWFAKATGNADANRAAQRAADVFLKRRLFSRISNGEVMNPQFVRLHYPCYWRYDILFSLKVMAEAGFIGDPRCKEALDLLQSKELPGGGWPAEERFYRTAEAPTNGCELVSWGGVNKRKPNEWVTADALYVLRSAGRLE